VGTPVDLGVAALDEPLLVEPLEEPLVPLVVFGRAGGDLPLPVVAKAHRLHLFGHGLDAVERPVAGIRVALFGRVLRGETERVPAHRMEDIVAAHPAIPSIRVRNRVVANVSHVEFARRIRVHSEDVRRILDVVGRPIDVRLVPRLLPAPFDRRVVVSRVAHLLIYVTGGDAVL